MKKIMFLYHVQEREYEIIKLIEREIKQITPNVEIKSGEFHSTLLDTILFMPDVIVSIPPRDIYASNCLTVLKIITGAVVISMSTEGEYRFIPQMIQNATGLNTYAKELVDYYIMWGSKTKAEFGKYLIKDGKLSDMKRIKVTGYAYYEIDKIMEEHKKHDKYSLLKDWFAKFEKNLLVLTGFFFADISLKDYQMLGYFGNNKPINQRTSEEINCARETIKADAEFRRKYIDMVISLAKLYPKLGIIVKLHPVEINEKNKFYDELTKYHNILLIKEAIPVGIMLEYTDVMIHYNSTCNSEAYIYKVPTIQVYGSSDSALCEEVQWNIKSDSTYLVHIDDFQELNSLIEAGIKFKKNYATEQRLYDLFNWQKGKAYNAIEKNAYYISNAKKPQRLHYRDKEVVKALRSKQGQKIIDMLIWDIVEKLNKNKRVWRNFYALFRISKYDILGRLFIMRKW